MRHTLLSASLFGTGLILLPADQALCYELGQGMHAGDYYVSGYANVEVADRFDVPSKLGVDDLSMFVGGRVNQYFNPFTEIELAKHTLIQQGGGAVQGDVIVERFYNDTLLSEHNTLRLGKILTPLGDWNLIHAAPLTPIITRPYTTALGFDAYTSGVSWLHDPENGKTFDFQLYGEPVGELFKRPASQSPRNFRNTYGGHINLPLGLLDKVGASFQHSQLIETGETFTLYGINANKSFGKLNLQSEAVTAHFAGTVLSGAAPRFHNNESGIFALADYSVTPQWHGILEGEYYQDHLVALPSRSMSIDIAYRPSAPVVWKLEYTHQAGVSASFAPIQTGLKASFSTLF